MSDSDDGEHLFSRLRRIVMSVRTAAPLDDRRRLLAMEADLRLVRDDLNRRCGLLARKYEPGRRAVERRLRLRPLRIASTRSVATVQVKNNGVIR